MRFHLPVLKANSNGNGYANGAPLLTKATTKANPGWSNLRPFKKGDARINRKGTPSTFAHFREICQRVARESIEYEGQHLTRAEVLARNWSVSKEPILQRAFAEYAFGKVPDKIEATGLENKTTLVLHYAHERQAIEAQEVESTTPALPTQTDDGDTASLDQSVKSSQSEL